MGYVYYYGRRDYGTALGEFETRAARSAEHADINASIGQHQPPARRLAGRRRWVTSVPPRSIRAIRNGRSCTATRLTTMRRYAQAEPAYERARAIDPDSTTAALFECLSLMMSGELERANAILDALPRDADPEGLGSSMRFIAAWLARDADKALAVLATAPPSIDAPVDAEFRADRSVRAQGVRAEGRSRQRAAGVHARARHAGEDVCRRSRTIRRR